MMKTKLAILLALCLPACAQFRFFHALATWKGASSTNLLQLWLPLAEASGDAIASVGPNFPVTGSVGALSPGRGTFATNNLFSHSDSFAVGLASNSFTITAWVKVNSIQSNVPPVILIESSGTTNTLALFGPSTNALGGSCEFYMFGTGGIGPGLIRDDIVSTNAWHFIVAQYLNSPQTISMSFDNSSFTNNVFAFTPQPMSGQTFFIGMKRSVSDPLIADPLSTGYLQHVRIFTRILSAAEITSYYNGGTPN